MIRLREEHNKKKRIEYEEYQKQRIQEFHNEIEQLKTRLDNLKSVISSNLPPCLNAVVEYL